MLREFISVHSEQILARARSRAEKRRASVATGAESTDNLVAFLNQLSENLRKVSVGEPVEYAEIDRSAGQQGHALFGQGTTMEQVVHEYGDFCQVISGLAREEGVSIPAGDLQMLGLCLDAAIAGAVSEHMRDGERAIRRVDTDRFGALTDLHRQLTDFVSTVAPGDEVSRSWRSVPSASEHREEAAPAERRAEADGRGTLFVVDRDPHIRRLVQQFVRDDYIVECFDDGYSVLDGVRRSAPSALITEILIPRLDGLALCRLIKEDPVTEHVPVLVSSVLAAEERARKSGADAFLEKPLERKRLAASLSALAQARGRRGPIPLQDQGSP
jgi:CheY-like chemotaxis protein